MSLVSSLTVKIFADGADLAGMSTLARNPLVQGFTTNPTLMRKAGIEDYAQFARDVLAVIPDKPISFEVFSDDFTEMEAQAHEIASWGANVYVKIPVTNTRGESAAPLIRRLTAARIKINVTAIMTLRQVDRVIPCLTAGVPAYVSVFAGRIADAGQDPLPVMKAAVERLRRVPAAELIWASPREVLNVVQADRIGCHVITITGDLMAKLPSLGKDLEAFSLDTVRMFRDDAVRAGFVLQSAAELLR
jgi:transaldolase